MSPRNPVGTMLGKWEVIEWSRCRPSERRCFFDVSRKDIARIEWSSISISFAINALETTRRNPQTGKLFFRAKVDDRNRDNYFLIILHN